MRPLRITIDGLRSYRTAQTIDFTDRDLCAVIGDTGAGKSSILEAIVFALYGRSSMDFQGQTRALVSDARDSMRVAMDFQADGGSWRVERVVWHASSSKPSSHKLERLDERGRGVGRWDGANEVNAQVERLVGLDHTAFLRAVLLPQGRFAELLKSRESERSSILQTIFGLDELTEVGSQVGERTRQAQAALDTVRQLRAPLGDDPAGQLEQAAAALEALATQSAAIAPVMARAEEGVRVAAGHRTAAADAAARADTAAAVVRALDRSDTGPGAPDVASALHALAALDRELSAEQARVSRRLATARSDRDTGRQALAERRQAGLDSATLQAAQSRLTDLVEEARGWAKAVRASTEAAAALPALRVRLEQAGQRAAAAAEALEAAEDKLAEVRTAHAAAVAALERGTRAFNSALKADADVATARARAESATTAAEEAQQAARAAEAVQRAAETAVRQARLGLDQAIAGDHAAALAAGLHAGDTCPVCTSTVPDGFGPSDSPDLAAARAEIEAAEARLGQARAEAGSAASTAASHTASAEAARARLEEQTATRDEVVGSLGMQVGIPAGELRTVLAGSEPAAPATDLSGHPVLGGLAAAVPAVDDVAVRAAQERQRSARRDHEAAASAVQQAEGRRDLTERAARDAAARLQRTVQAQPERFRPVALTRPGLDERLAQADADLLAAVDPLDDTAVRGVIADALAATRTLDEQVETADAAVADAERAAEALRARRLEQVDAPRASLTRVVLTQQAKLEAAAEGTEQADMVTGALRYADAADEGLGSLVRAAGTLRSTATALKDASAAESARASAAADHATREVVDAVAALLGPADPTRPEREAETAEQACRRVQDHAASIGARVDAARREHQRTQADAERAATYERVIADAEPVVHALDLLRRHLTDAKFLGYVTRVRQVRLLGVASERLAEMTGGRYGFNADFQLFDTLTGRARAAATLSGGEQFLASLALSLAMVEIAGRAGGRIDAVFLDEGFGSLDGTALDEALDLLETQAADGRLLVVISHIRAVAERISSVLRVTSDAAGASAVEWLSDADRMAFLSEDADQAAAAGLL